MKKILFLLLITSAAYSQNTTNPIKQVRPFTFQYRPDSITPVWSSSFQNGDHALCLQDSSMWVYNKAALKWRKAQTVGGAGKDGISPTVNIKSVTTATGAAGTNAVVGVTDSDPSANVDLNFSFIIPRGADGTGGGGTQVVLNSMLELLNYTNFSNVVFVKSFHAGQYLGGGWWFADTYQNADFIDHFKSKANTSYVWHRYKTKPCLDYSDFGAANGIDSKTLSQYGYINADVSALFDPAYSITLSDLANYAAWVTVLKAPAKSTYMCVENTPLATTVNKSIEAVKKPSHPAYAEGSVVEFDNNGGYVSLTGQNTTLIKRSVASWSEGENDNAIANLSFHISKFLVQGEAGKAQSLFEINSSYTMHVFGNKTRNVDYPFTYNHCMNSQTIGNMLLDPIEGVRIRSQVGIYPDATESNSGSNLSIIQSNKAHMSSRGKSAFTVDLSSTPYFNVNVIEGAGTPETGIWLNGGTGTWTKDGYINILHSEIATTKGMIYTNLKYTNINGVWNQYSQNLVNHYQAVGYPVVRITNTCWKFQGVKFKASASDNTWMFENISEQDGDVTDVKFWDGAMPRLINQEINQRLNFRTAGGSQLQYNGKEAATK